MKKMIATDVEGSSIIEGTGDLSDAAFVQRFVLSEYWIDAQKMSMSFDGKHLYITTGYEKAVAHYELSTPFDISTMTFQDTLVFNFGIGGKLPVATAHVKISDDGLTLNTFTITSSPTTQYVVRHSLPTAYSLVGASRDAVTISGGTFLFPPSSPDIIIKQGPGNNYTQYEMSTAWDVSTATFQETSPVDPNYPSSVDVLHSIGFGDRAYTHALLPSNTATIVQYNYGTRWDVGTFAWQATTNIRTYDNASERTAGVEASYGVHKLYTLVKDVTNSETIIYEFDMV